MWKHWLTMAGWTANKWFHALGLHRLPLLGGIWFTGKRLAGKWLASGRGVPVRLDGQDTYVHPFTIVYSIEEWEPYTEELFQNAIKPGSTVLDIGAHHGYFSMLAARQLGTEGKVYAFEPAVENFEILKTNIKLNQLTNVIPVNKAASDKRGTVPFFIEKSNDVQGSLFSTLRAGEFTVPVECITIDEFIGGEPVDVIKMDIEGGEPYALEGMKDTLAQNKDIVLFIEF